jgi:hypothetical protein
MKPRSLLVVSASILVIALVVWLWKIFHAGVDSPITVADGSITLTREKGKKFNHDPKSDKHHGVNDSGFAVTSIEVVGCPAASGCANDKPYNLTNVDNWVLTLNDGTAIQQDGQKSPKFDIQLANPATWTDDTITMKDPNLSSAELTIGGGGNIVQKLICPTPGAGVPKCRMTIHYKK